MYKKTTRTILVYATGIVLWLVLLAAIQVRCISNISLFIDNLWTREVNTHLRINILGNLAYRTSGLGCADRLIYTIRYYPEGSDGAYQARALSSLVDVDSWQEVSSDNISKTYIDKYYRYVLYNTSDSVYMRVFDK